MNLQSVSLKNFTNYRQETVDLTDIHLAALTGRNGSGKSSLMPDSILYALFGATERSNLVDDLVTKNQKDMEVGVEFTIGGQRWKVIRSRQLKGRGKTTLALYQWDNGWINRSGKDIADTQKSINDLLGMDYNSFKASVFALQGQADNFTSARPAERKDILFQVLGLSEWASYEEVVKDQVKQVKIELQVLERQEAQLQEEVADKDDLIRQEKEVSALLAHQDKELKKLEKQGKKLQKEYNQLLKQEEARRQVVARVASIKKSIDETYVEEQQYSQKLKQAQAILDRRNEVLAAVAKESALKTQIDILDHQAAEVLELSKKIEQLDKKMAVHDRKIAADKAKITASLNAKKEQAAVMNAVPCNDKLKPSCPLLSQAVAASRELKSLEKELKKLEKSGNPYAEQYNELVAKRDAIQYDAKAHQKLKAELDKVRQVATLQVKIDVASKQIEEYQELITKTVKKRQELEAELQSIEVPAETNIKDIETQIKANQQEVAGVREDIADLREQLGSIKAQLEAVQEAEKTLAEVISKTADLKTNLYRLQVLQKAFGRDGIPAMIMSWSLPELESQANKVLDILQGGKLSVHFETTIETKSGTTRDGLEIYVSAPGGVRPYSTYSGAEKFSIDLALRIALALCVARRHGRRIETMVLDEGAGVLDPVGRQNLVEALRYASQYFSKIIFITHIEELQDVFPQRLEVVGGQEGAKVVKVA
ncbi:hypothetical protein MTAT_19470 [Moorella thermoacetica]|uniref:Nuclease SbcCD subunit C n=1 Tax=Neomoorella thermoacetica TaxID=1525 RepID=A0AAC9HIM1_NEOTH|nr:SMC family ATPase [Moorella thermoacetica]AOQ24604.1 Nuclease SbcCD subunit C [Moorella thermoacetica]TYL12705.1 hypothetical protein MTAT_19470 [Moorella thermoacetica]